MANYNIQCIDAAKYQVGHLYNATLAAVESCEMVQYNLNSFRDINRFAEKRQACIDSLTALSDNFHYVVEDLSNCGYLIETAFFDIFEGYLEPGDIPVTTETIGKLKGESIRNDSLQEPLYLDPYIFATAVRSNAVNLSVDSAPIEAFTHRNPEDMYAETILTRTTLYLALLREKEQQEWFYSAASMFKELSESALKCEQMIYEMKEALQSDQMEEAALKIVGNAAYENQFIAWVDTLIKTNENVSNALASTKDKAYFFANVTALMEPTQAAIHEAYDLLVEANGITF